MYIYIRLYDGTRYDGIPEGVAMRGNGTVPVQAPRYGPVCVSSRTCKKAGVSYLMTGCRDQSSFSGIIPVKPGWLVGMDYEHHTRAIILYSYICRAQLPRLLPTMCLVCY